MSSIKAKALKASRHHGILGIQWRNCPSLGIRLAPTHPSPLVDCVFFLYQPLTRDDRSSVVPDNAARLTSATGEGRPLFSRQARETTVPTERRGDPPQAEGEEEEKEDGGDGGE